MIGFRTHDILHDYGHLEDHATCRKELRAAFPEARSWGTWEWNYLACRKWDAKASDHLDDLLRLYPLAQLVLTSNWRQDNYTLDDYKLLFAQGCGLVSQRFSGALVEYINQDEYATREVALHKWLQDHPGVRRVLLIDHHFKNEDGDQWKVRVLHPTSLLTHADVVKAVEIISSMKPAAPKPQQQNDPAVVRAAEAVGINVILAAAPDLHMHMLIQHVIHRSMISGVGTIRIHRIPYPS